MGDLISREAAMQNLCETLCGREPDKCNIRCTAGKFLEGQPAVNAIPVEWLEQMSFETSYNGAKPNIDLNYAFCTVINEWQKEREAAAHENHTG